MSTKIIRIHNPRRNPARVIRDDSPAGIKLDMLTLRALAVAVADELIVRGCVPPTHELMRKIG